MKENKYTFYCSSSFLSSCSNNPVSIWFGRGGNTVSESHTYPLAPLQKRHEGGCGERGETRCWVLFLLKWWTCIRKLPCLYCTVFFDFTANKTTDWNETCKHTQTWFVCWLSLYWGSCFMQFGQSWHSLHRLCLLFCSETSIQMLTAVISSSRSYSWTPSWIATVWRCLKLLKGTGNSGNSILIFLIIHD